MKQKFESFLRSEDEIFIDNLEIASAVLYFATVYEYKTVREIARMLDCVREAEYFLARIVSGKVETKYREMIAKKIKDGLISVEPIPISKLDHKTITTLLNRKFIFYPGYQGSPEWFMIYFKKIQVCEAFMSDIKDNYQHFVRHLEKDVPHGESDITFMCDEPLFELIVTAE